MPQHAPDEVAIGRAAIAVAKAAGGPRSVYHSVLHPHTEKMPHHWHKLRVEELLFESGLEWTILQPAAYMQNVLVT
ncbi:MAG: NmrA family NAD(P)-binding protein [Anaerolineae bacterium]